MSDKLEPKSDKYFFVGYPNETRDYYFYYPSKNKIIVARHAVFFEKEFLSRESSRSEASLEEVQETPLNDTIRGDYVTSALDIEVSSSTAGHISQVVVEEVRASPQKPMAQVQEELNPQGVVEEVPQKASVLILRRSIRIVCTPESYMGLHEVTVLDTENPMTYKEALIGSTLMSGLKS
jgi:hypothetical protein